MAWVGVALSAFIAMEVFLVSVRNVNRANPFSGSLCDLFLLEHMLPDGHPLEFMYKGLPRIKTFPRLLWPCATTFACTGLALVAAGLAIALGSNGILGNEIADTTFVCSCIGSSLATNFGLMAIPEIQNAICFKRMAKMDMAQVGQIRANIEEKWPGFYGPAK